MADTVTHERWKRRMESDFSPGSADHALAPEHRMLNAVEYAAYQLGQISRNLARIADHLEKTAK